MKWKGCKILSLLPIFHLLIRTATDIEPKMMLPRLLARPVLRATAVVAPRMVVTALTVTPLPPPRSQATTISAAAATMRSFHVHTPLNVNIAARTEPMPPPSRQYASMWRLRAVAPAARKRHTRSLALSLSHADSFLSPLCMLSLLILSPTIVFTSRADIETAIR